MFIDEKILLGIFGALFVSFMVTPLVKKLAVVVGAVDKPNDRKVHNGLMPRIGGVAIYLGFVTAILFSMKLNGQVLGLLLSCTLIMALGLIDDIKGISPKVKLLGQIVASLILVCFGVRVDSITNPFIGGSFNLGILSIPVTILWITGVSNAVNLIDGLDGLAAGVSAIAAVTLAVVAWTQGQFETVFMALFLAASILGFLRYNFHPAQLFMGDCGSLFLGFTLGSLAILGVSKSATVISIFIPIIILGIPIMDTLFAITRRYNNKQPIFQADRGHLHHRLLDMGLSHTQTVLLIYTINFILGSSAVLLTVLTTAQSVMILIGLSVAVLLGANYIGIITGKSVPVKEPEREEQRLGA